MLEGLRVGQAEQMMNHWLRHRRVLEELLKTIPDEQIGYKPWDGAMALGELAQHIAASADMFVALAKTGDQEIKPPEPADCKTMEEVRRIVTEYTEKTRATFASLTDEELEIHYDSPHPNFRGPRKNLLLIAIDHEIHHKGQLFVYARMIGTKDLPFFI